MHIIERGTRLYGVPVIALAEGIRLGRVIEVFIDKPGRKIMGMSYGSGIFGSDTERYADFADIQKFSRDVVIISSRTAARQRPIEAVECGLKSLKGYKVTTHAGKHIGELVDLMLNRDDGRIMEIVLTERRKLAVDLDNLVIGPDVIMVPAGSEDHITAMGPEHNDFIDRIFGSAAVSETVREGFEGVRTSMRNNVNTDKMKRTLRSGSQKARDTVLRTSQVIQHNIEQIMKKRTAQKDRAGDQETEVMEPVDVNTGQAAGRSDPIDASGSESMPEDHRAERPENGSKT